MSQKFDVVVIGAGPGGYVCAIKAAQLGFNVALIDKRNVAGGTCLNVGCIPSKALLHSTHKFWEIVNHSAGHGIEIDGWRYNLNKMQQRKEAIVSELTKGIDFLLRKNNIKFFQGEATFETPHCLQVKDDKGTLEIIEGDRFVIATGSQPASLPGITIDEEKIVSSTGALSFEKVPKHLVIIGGGYIGLELGSVWSRLGAAVTVVEYMDRIVPSMDLEVATAFQKELTSQGFTFKLGRKVVNILKEGKEMAVHALKAADEKGPVEIIGCDRVLMAVGRLPCTKALGLEKLGIAPNDRGFVEVNHKFQTSLPHIYAIGDVIPGPMLAHKAEEEGMAVAEIMAGQAGHVDYDLIPGVVYTSPEVASLGLTEEQVKAKGISYNVGKFPFSANSRAKAVGETKGFVKIISDKKTDRLLGVHIMGSQAGNMIAEIGVAMAFHGSSEDVARICHAHPTHNEAIKEAALATYDRPIHV